MTLGHSSLVAFVKATKQDYLRETQLSFWEMFDESQRGPNKLQLEGLDLTDSYYFVDELSRLFDSIDTSITQNDLWITFQNLSETMLPAEKNPTEKTLKEYTESAEFVIEIIKSKTKEGAIDEVESKRWLQLLKVAIGTKKWYVQRPEKYKNDMGFHFYEQRDRLMADNLLWLIEQKYPGKKIIVSTSTYHMTRNVKYILTKKTDIIDTKPMREYIWEKHKGEIYSIAFIEYTGETADKKKPKPVYRKKKNSIEAMLHDTGFKYALLDLNSLSKMEGGQWLGGNFIMSPTFRKSNLTAQWIHIYDGLFYSDVVTPNNYRLIPNSVLKEAEVD